MWPARLLLVVVLAAGLCVAQLPAFSLTGLSPEQQRNSTAFVLPDCSPDANAYTYNIINSFVTPMDFTVSHECQGTGASTQEVSLGPLQISQRFAIQPASGAVANRVCHLMLRGVDPFDTSPDSPQVLFSNFTSTCGSVIIDDDDGCSEDEDDDCGWGAFWCEYQHGNWEASIVVWLIHALIISTPIATLIGLAYVIPQERMSKRRKELYDMNSGPFQEQRGRALAESRANPEPHHKVSTVGQGRFHEMREVRGGGRAKVGKASTHLLGHRCLHSDEEHEQMEQEAAAMLSFQSDDSDNSDVDDDGAFV